MNHLLSGKLRVRRIVTGHNQYGESTVLADTILLSKKGRRGGYRPAPIWATETLPPQLLNQEEEDDDHEEAGLREDPSKWSVGTCLPGGSVFRLVRYEPGVAERWHQTNSLDYGIVLAGTLWLALEDREVQLHAGDVIIQRATMHNWENLSTEPCVVVFVLLGTETEEQAY